MERVFRREMGDDLHPPHSVPSVKVVRSLHCEG